MMANGDGQALGRESGLGWPEEPPPTLDEHLDFIAQILCEAPEEAPWWIWSIAARDAECALGAAGFSGPPDEHGLVWVGYALYAAERGRGVASEAVAALLAYAFSDSRVRAVMATIARDNRPSRRLAERVGMRYHGRYRQSCIYRVTRGQWQDAA